MKNLILVSSIIAVTSFMQLSQAKTGDINFTGSLTAATCSATAPGSTANNINVPMGIVSIADLEDGSTGQASTTTQLQGALTARARPIYPMHICHSTR